MASGGKLPSGTFLEELVYSGWGLRSLNAESQGWKGMLKKQSLISMTASVQSQGSMLGNGRLGCTEPMSSMTSLIVLGLWRSLLLSLLGFLITKTGEFQGLFDGTMWPLESCSPRRDSRAHSFSVDRGLGLLAWEPRKQPVSQAARALLSAFSRIPKQRL